MGEKKNRSFLDELYYDNIAELQAKRYQIMVNDFEKMYHDKYDKKYFDKFKREYIKTEEDKLTNINILIATYLDDYIEKDLMPKLEDFLLELPENKFIGELIREWFCGHSVFVHEIKKWVQNTKNDCNEKNDFPNANRLKQICKSYCDNLDQKAQKYFEKKSEEQAAQGTVLGQNNRGGLIYEQKLFDQFPVFKQHSEYLKNKGYYKINVNHLQWIHGGNLLLAAYFGMIQDIPGNIRFIWGLIEEAFKTKHLAQFYSDYETMRKGKTNKHAKYDKDIRELVAGNISL